MVKSILAAFASVTLLFVGCLGSVHATTYSFFGEDNVYHGRTQSDIAHALFMAKLSGAVTETFDTKVLGTGAPLSLDFGLAGFATLYGTGFVDDQQIWDRWATSGTQYWEAQSTNFSIQFDVNKEVAAFGFYGTDIGDIWGQLKLKLTYLDDSIQEFIVPNTINAVSGSGLFWGFINTDKYFKSIAFSTTAGSDHFGFDDMTVGAKKNLDPVPEPATMMLMGAGLAVLAGVRARRKK